MTKPDQAARPTEAPEASDNPEPRTFAGVLRAHQSMVFSIAYHFLRDRSAAEEVAQDVFLQLHRRFNDAGLEHSFESDMHLSFWLRKVASHRSIDYARKQKSNAAICLEDAPATSMASAEEQPRDHFLHRRLQALIGSLPEKPRMVMVLRYQEDMMPEEIASVLDMPVRTVKSHLQRSIAMLREKIDRTMGDVR